MTITYVITNTAEANTAHGGIQDQNAASIVNDATSADLTSVNHGPNVSMTDFSFTTQSGEPNEASWPTGLYECFLDVSAAGGGLTYGLLNINSLGHFGRINDARDTEVEAHQQDEVAFSGTGLKVATYSGPWGGSTASDRFECLVAISRDGVNHGNQALTMTVNNSGSSRATGAWVTVTPSAHLHVVDEDENISHDQARQMDLARIDDDTVTLTHAQNRIMTLARSVDEVQQLQEDFLSAQNMLLQIDETEQIAENSIAAQALLREVASTLQINEAVLQMLGKIQVVDETQEIGVAGGGDLPVLESFLSSDGGTTGSDTLTLDKPSGVVSGDLLMLIACNDNPSATVQFTDNKSGWNFVGTSGNSTSDSHIGVFWKISDGGEGASESVVAATVRFWCGFYLRISGADITTPINVSNFQAEAANASHTVDSVTTTVDNCLGLCALSFDGGDGLSFTVGSNDWAKDDDVQCDTSASTNSAVFGSKDIPSEGGSGNAIITPAVNDSAAFLQMAIAPATGGGVEAIAILGLNRILDNTLSLSENNERVFALVRVQDSTLQVTEQALKNMTILRIQDETINISSNIVHLVEIPGGLNLVEILDENVNIPEGFVRLLDITRIDDDTLQLVESIVQSRDLLRLLSDTVEVVEGSVPTQSKLRTLTETIEIAAQTIKVSSLTRLISDTINIQEAINHIRSFFVVVNDTIQISTSAIANFGAEIFGFLVGTVSVSAVTTANVVVAAATQGFTRVKNVTKGIINFNTNISDD